MTLWRRTVDVATGRHGGTDARCRCVDVEAELQFCEPHFRCGDVEVRMHGGIEFWRSGSCCRRADVETWSSEILEAR